MNPELSVILVTWNTSAMTLECVKCLHEIQGVELEVIVSDNGSKDDTVEKIKQYYPQVKLVENGRNLGFAAAVNRGADQAKGAFVLLFNNDARIDSHTLRSMLDEMKSDESIGVCGPQLIYENNKLQNSIAAKPSLATELLNKSLLKAMYPNKYASRYDQSQSPREVESVIGACLLTRRSLFESLNGLDERYFFYLEETDYCCRVKEAGQSIRFFPQYQVVHLQGATVEKVRVKAKIEYQRSLLTFFKKHHGFAQTLMLQITLFTQQLFKWVTTSLAILLTLGLHQKLKLKWVTYSQLILWQCMACPASFGLQGNE